MRKHYVTLCFMGDSPIKVTYIDRKDGKGIEVLFERACDGGFDDLCMRLDCSVISRKGYTDDEVEFLKKVLEGCKDTIAEEALIA